MTRASGTLRFFLSVAAAVLPAATAFAGSSWDDIRSHVFADKAMKDGHGIITLTAPIRPEDQRAVPVTIDADLKDGRSIKTITLVVDENPSPVAAVFHFDKKPNHANLGLNIRLNQQSQVRAIVETSDGEFFSVDRLVKFAGGQAACAAPPTGDPAEIARNMGKMELHEKVADAGVVSSRDKVMELKLSHPNHTGMQLDQLTLLYIPLKMISEIKIKQGDQNLMAIEGSIALSENPKLVFVADRKNADDMTITFSDSDGRSWTKKFPAPPQS